MASQFLEHDGDFVGTVRACFDFQLLCNSPMRSLQKIDGAWLRQPGACPPSFAMDEAFEAESTQWAEDLRSKRARYSVDLLVLSPDKLERSTGVPLAVCSTLKSKAEGEFDQWQAHKRQGLCVLLGVALPLTLMCCSQGWQPQG